MKHGRLSRTSIALFAAVAIAISASASASGTPGDELTSTNWSGYLIDGGPFSVTEATFNVPNLTAASQTVSTSEWVGVDGSGPTDRSLIQAGIRETYDPRSNLVHFHTWWEILPALEQDIVLRVTAGDRVRVSIGGVGNGMWRIEIDNLSTGRRFVTTQAYSGPGRTADWVLEAPADRFGRVQPLGHYVPNVTFTDLRATGTRGLLHPLTMLQNGVVVSKVSRLMPHGFTVSYK